MLVDEVAISLKAGDGGKGVVAFSRVRLVKGPTGADGGNGGDVVVEGIRDIGGLQVYAGKPSMEAENGGQGGTSLNDGPRGEELVLRIPIGTTIENLSTNEMFEVEDVGQEITLLRGGKGGKGNYKFRSSVNTSPWESEEGTAGEAAEFSFKLRLIADVGLIGLPNAGKSSLLNELTNAKSKVANYAFTTLEPHLGSYYGLILADIPGLIEGASEGRGLGVKFLKHIERTQVFFHLVSMESDDPLRDYQTVRREIIAFNPALSEKPEHVFLSKADTADDEAVKAQIAAFKKAGIEAQPLSLIDEASMKGAMATLNAIKDKTA